MVTRVAGATGTTSVTMPSHQAGDLLVAFAFRDGSTSAATVPAGWSLVNAAGANTCWGGLYYKVAASSSETSGTWTSASRLSVVSYRPASGKGIGIGQFASGSGATSSVAYNTFTLASGDGSSWVAGVAGYRTVNTSLETPPTGMTNVAAATGVDATAEIAWHDTDAGVASWSTQSVSVGGTASGWRSYAFEIVDTATWSPREKGGGITLSGSNLTAAGSSGESVRTTVGSAGKIYFEVVTTTTDTVGGQALGFANAVFGITSDSTDTPNAITAWTDGNVYMNDDLTPVGSWASGTWPAGTVISGCIDGPNKTFWAKKNSGNWNDSGSADPATNTGGYTITNAGPYFGLFTGTHASSSVTLQTATRSIPTGFADIMASGSSYTGIGAATLAVTASGSGVHGVSGTASATLGVTGSGAGTHAAPVTGTGAATLAITGSGAGVHGVAGTASASLSVTGSGSATHLQPVTGTGAATLTLAATGTGKQGVTGAASATLVITGSGTGAFSNGVTGIGSAVLGVTGSAAGVHGVSGAAAAILALSASAAGIHVPAVGGIGSATLTITGDGLGSFGAEILAYPVQPGSATAGTITGRTTSAAPVAGQTASAGTLPGSTSITANPVSGRTIQAP